MLSEPRAAELLASLSTLLRTSRAVQAKMHGSSITGTQVGALKVLADHELRMGDLADRLLVAPSVASRVVATLEQDGLVERHLDPADARACLLGLTDRGRDRLHERERFSLRLICDVLADWTDEEAAAASEAMDRLDRRIPDFSTRMLAQPAVARQSPDAAPTTDPAPATDPAPTRAPRTDQFDHVLEMETVSR